MALSFVFPTRAGQGVPAACINSALKFAADRLSVDMTARMTDFVSQRCESC